MVIDIFTTEQDLLNRTADKKALMYMLTDVLFPFRAFKPLKGNLALTVNAQYDQ